jgi:hypothetical protein
MRESATDILNQSFVGNIKNLIIYMPRRKIILDGLTRLRKNKNIINVNNIGCERMQVTLGDKRFLFYNHNVVGEPSLKIYLSHTNLIHMENSDVLVGGGTFYSCPVEFSQLYTIQGRVRGNFCLFYIV